MLPTCKPGIDCACCANLTAICSSKADCNQYDQGSLCGCRAGGPGNGRCGPFCIKEGQDAALCNFTRLIGNTNTKLVGGVRCTYAGQDSLGSFFPGLYNYFVEPAIRSCRPPGYVQIGSALNRDLELISSTPRSHVTVMGDVAEIKNTLSTLMYTTQDFYNRLYRPPVNLRDPVTFDIEADSTDSLEIEVSDLGNSGGMSYDPRTAKKSITLRIVAVNNAPVSNGPEVIYATEDKAYEFVAGTRDGLYITDPDSGDYGFTSGIFTVNMSCVNGRLFLNETFLQTPGVSTVRITYKNWADPRMELRGLHTVRNKLSAPVFGGNCQAKIQCSDGSQYTSDDTKYGFYKSAKYGIVYSPVTVGGIATSLGCGICPEDAGNKFLSIEGVMDDINRALSLVTYLPDPNFNTRTLGSKDTITLNVSDNGDMGNDASSPSLTDSLQISVIVESVNDRPVIGRKIVENRIITSYFPPGPIETKVSDTAIVAINTSLGTLCSTLRPSGSDYERICGPSVRQYIDIDEGGIFIITADVFWIFDIDAQEAENMATPRRYCCKDADPEGCFCQVECSASCPQPQVCSSASSDRPPGSPGQMLINLSSTNGLLSFYPPPGRSVYPTSKLMFLTLENSKMVACPDQLQCMRNMSWIAILTTLQCFQDGVENLYLTYQGKPYFYGRDVISIWVSDQGFTDECYSDVLTATAVVDVRVVAINNAPIISSDFTVMSYDQGLRCYVDYMKFPRYEESEGLSPTCTNSNESNVPPSNSGKPFHFSDIDMDATKYGNMTLLLTVGALKFRHSYAGSFMLVQIIKRGDIWFEQFRNFDGLRVFSIQGKMEEINSLMPNLRFDADPNFAGYVPINIIANDMGNFGECDGNHVCGFKQDKCPDHNKAGSHNPATQGLTVLQIDVVIQAPKVCIVNGRTFRSDCDTCNLIAGCGWCPGFCGTGKCMVDGNGRPLFEKCEVGTDGRGWKMCQNTGGDIGRLMIVVIVPVVGIFIIFAVLVRWVARRHGSFPSYGKHIRLSFYRYGQKLKLLPSNDANWLQFFTLVLSAGIIVFVVLVQTTVTPQCNFRSDFFMDKVTAISMTLDNCMVRFVPTRNQGYPDNLLPQPKIKVAYTNDPLIDLEAQTCDSHVSLNLKNNRDSATKYIGYFCNIEILVPDRIVMPDVSIIAAGENLTTVRSGSMDKDSPNFGMDFGPNRFSLQGYNLVARLQNVSSKYFDYNVVHGELVATDITATKLGNFQSEDANMIVTSTLQCHAHFWQKENNLVCLTTAPGSLYVKDSCVRTCRYPNITKSLNLRSVQGQNSTMLPQNEFSSRRQSFDSNPWLCTGIINVDKILNCTHFNPIQAEVNDTCPAGAKYKKKSEVPVITGCYDLDLCTLNESPQCLCKPYCDMAGLKPVGQCDELGRCCQEVCGGYSQADLFPTPNMPRCGSAIDPISMPWCDGSGMRQNYVFTSTSGQISLQVLAATWNSSVSSFKGGPAISDASPTIGILEANLPIVDALFHPDGAFYPEQDIFRFTLSGPGSVDASIGQFAWVRNVQYILFDSFFLNFFSFSILDPRVDSSQITVKPGFCPVNVEISSPQFNRRLIQMQTLLLNTIQDDPPTKPIPSGSLLIFEGERGVRIFFTDPNSNEPALVYFDTAPYNLSLIVVYLAIALPAVASILSILLAFQYYSTYLSKFRTKKMEEQRLTRNINILLQPNRVLDEADYDEIARNQRALTARTNLFYMFEESFADPEEQRTLIADFFFVIIELVIVLGPAIIVFYAANLLKVSYQAQLCQYRPDYCSCLKETSQISNVADALTILVYIYFVSAVGEMSAHYLCFKLTVLTRFLRGMFLFFFFLLIGLSLFYITTIIVFILLGVLLRPQASIPYAIAVAGTLGCTFSLYMALHKYQVEIEMEVRKRVKKIEEERKLADKIPKALLALFVEKNVVKALRNLGISAGHRISYSVIFASALVLTYAFLIVGFQAFTNMNKTLNSIINSLLVGVLAFLGQLIANNVVDKSLTKAKEEEAATFLKKVFKILLNQIHVAERLIGSLESQINDPLLGEFA